MKATSWRRLLAVCTGLLFSGCANIRPPEPPSLQLPKPPSDLRAVRKGHQVSLSWTIPRLTSDRQTIESLGPTRICRSIQPVLSECQPIVGTLPPRAARKPSNQKETASYIDTLPDTLESDDPASRITYGVEVLNNEGRGAGVSNLAGVPLVRTMGPPQDVSAEVTKQGVMLRWTSQRQLPVNGVRYLDRVYRRQEGSEQSMLAGELGEGSEATRTFIDANVEWQKTYEYRVDTVSVIDQEGKPPVEVVGDDSAEIKVFADDRFPPTVPSGLQAAFSGPGQPPFVDLIWAPGTDSDLAGYNVYRREEGATPVKLNGDPLKTPAYRDSQVVPGRSYLYSVSAVDVRGNESARSEEAGEEVQ